ncbi:AAA family ATPase [Mycobacteroides abscessus subsp. abscessus]|uniref:McrB family protein n=1 Tax=Mycobacteroides abscessus TaxID=36809 RepID=UPI00092651A4|nr:AAA family ATPase [Mycobacteroides abscessus]AWG48592.1 hypothetical protein DDT48_03735 [Mycobacteroides abscessus]MBN7551510.1 AAA family ATPase [Mycobacteroides abscessus subsp. abscessus]MDO3096587.1 AAA family ATPase [Mycobacteroides abscessus subsp. abscessus]MDO3189322.1 AAA family ATPase [Mycobacteroides abscessus subsp. abscessus]MDO3193603.1 AAA family ATPase [Mycobacteroides abscessus subsp. abscessus]
MVAQAVEAIWVWRFSKSTFKATYGRFEESKAGDSYTKNYLQVSGECRNLLSSVFHIPQEAGAKHEVTYVWPGGEVPGNVNWSVDRYHLNWPMGRAPQPWKLVTAPDSAVVGVIPGDPSRGSQDEADEEWAALDATNLAPYLVAVKLRGEQDRLHVRAYLDNPPAGMEWAALDTLPGGVPAAARTTNGNKACASLEVAGGVTAAPEVTKLIEHLDENPNALLVGPPGTGKTVLLEKLVEFVENSAGGLLFDPDEPHHAFSEAAGALPGIARTVVLHPAYSYENLVVGLLPVAAPGGGVVVEPKPGPLVELAKYASEPGRRALLVLDEFNRGNAAAVLGDTIALLDKDKRGRAVIDLPYSDGATVPAQLTLPENLWIVAAMNSSDRSVAPLDAALRRRFSIIEMPPDYSVLGQYLGADEDPDFGVATSEWTVATVASLAVELLRAVNSRIDAVLGADFRLGHSNFWGVGGETVEAAATSLISAFDYRIVASLKLAMQDDDGALSAVLQAGTSENPKVGSSTVAYWEKGDPALGTYASPRLHFRELSKASMPNALTELLRQAGH